MPDDCREAEDDFGSGNKPQAFRESISVWENRIKYEAFLKNQENLMSDAYARGYRDGAKAALPAERYKGYCEGLAAAACRLKPSDLENVTLINMDPSKEQPT